MLPPFALALDGARPHQAHVHCQRAEELLPHQAGCGDHARQRHPYAAQGMDSDPCFGQAGPVFGCAEGALDTGAAHRGSCRRTLGVSAPSGGKEPGLMTMGFPGGAQQREGSCGPGDVPIFGALAAVARDLEALTVNSGDLEEEGFMEPEAQARDRGEGDLVVERGGGRQESPPFLHTEDSGEVVGGLRAQERQRGPVALEDVLREEAHTAGAEAHGGWGEAVDVCAVQEGSAAAPVPRCGRGMCGRTAPTAGLPGQRRPASVRSCRGGAEPRSFVAVMGSCDISLRETRGRCAKEDIIDQPGKEERFHDCRVSGLLEPGVGADTGPRGCGGLRGSSLRPGAAQP